MKGGKLYPVDDEVPRKEPERFLNILFEWEEPPPPITEIDGWIDIKRRGGATKSISICKDESVQWRKNIFSRCPEDRQKAQQNVVKSGQIAPHNRESIE